MIHEALADLVLKHGPAPGGLYTWLRDNGLGVVSDRCAHPFPDDVQLSIHEWRASIYPQLRPE